MLETTVSILTITTIIYPIGKFLYRKYKTYREKKDDDKKDDYIGIFWL